MHMIEADVPFEDVQQIMGHARICSTADYCQMAASVKRKPKAAQPHGRRLTYFSSLTEDVDDGASA